MAFKILSQEEIERLSPDNKEVYQRAYNEFCEREAFVEKIEKQSKIKSPEISISKNKIKAIEKPNAVIPELGELAVDRNNTDGKLFNATKSVGKAIYKLERIDSDECYSVSKPILPNVACKNVDFSNNKIDSSVLLDDIMLASASDVFFDYDLLDVEKTKTASAVVPNSEFQLKPYTLNKIKALADVEIDMPDFAVEKYDVSPSAINIKKYESVDFNVKEYKLTPPSAFCVDTSKVKFKAEKVILQEHRSPDISAKDFLFKKPLNENAVLKNTAVVKPVEIAFKSKQLSIENVSALSLSAPKALELKLDENKEQCKMPKVATAPEINYKPHNFKARINNNPVPSISDVDNNVKNIFENRLMS